MRDRGSGTRIARVFIEPTRRGSVRLWAELGHSDCLVVESGTAEWDAIWQAAEIEPPSDFCLDAGGDLGEAVRQLRGKVIELGEVAA